MVGVISILLSCLNPGIHLVLHSIVDHGHVHEHGEKICHDQTKRSNETKNEVGFKTVDQDCYLCSLVSFIQPLGIVKHNISLDLTQKQYEQIYSKSKSQYSIECLSLYDARAGPKLS